MQMVVAALAYLLCSSPCFIWSTMSYLFAPLPALSTTRQVKWILSNTQATVEETNENGATALHYAALGGALEVALTFSSSSSFFFIFFFFFFFLLYLLLLLLLLLLLRLRLLIVVCPFFPSTRAPVIIRSPAPHSGGPVAD
jgi:hypothetical protein